MKMWFWGHDGERPQKYWSVDIKFHIQKRSKNPFYIRETMINSNMLKCFKILRADLVNLQQNTMLKINRVANVLEKISRLVKVNLINKSQTWKN